VAIAHINPTLSADHPSLTGGPVAPGRLSAQGDVGGPVGRAAGGHGPDAGPVTHSAGDDESFEIPRRQVNLLAIAEGFAASAADLPELRGQDARSWVLLAATDLFEAWAIGWPPGGKIELHDHGNSRGAVVVAEGVLTETTVRPTDRGVAVVSARPIRAGEHREFGQRYVHDLVNDGEQDAISVHVYGPKLRSMSYYQLRSSGRLEVVRSEEIEPVGPFDVTRDHDPS
jgi:predicted metal-dependent enzyme (double-stranded beta helix superfamily)